MQRHFGRIAAGFIAAPFALWGFASAYEEQFRAQAKSSVVRRKEDYLIRQYFPYLKAEISIPADNYIDAFERGGEQLNQYYNGANTRLMTITAIKPEAAEILSPVEAAKERIFLTIPDALRKDDDRHIYRVSQILDPTYNRSFIGKPNNPYINLREVFSETVAAHYFWGFTTRRQVDKHMKIFKEALERDGIRYKSIRIARYSDPWIFYFLRRNEIIATISQEEM